MSLTKSQVETEDHNNSKIQLPPEKCSSSLEVNNIADSSLAEINHSRLHFSPSLYHHHHHHSEHSKSSEFTHLIASSPFSSSGGVMTKEDDKEEDEDKEEKNSSAEAEKEESLNGSQRHNKKKYSFPPPSTSLPFSIRGDTQQHNPSSHRSLHGLVALVGGFVGMLGSSEAEKGGELPEILQEEAVSHHRHRRTCSSKGTEDNSQEEKAKTKEKTVENPKRLKFADMAAGEKKDNKKRSKKKSPFERSREEDSPEEPHSVPFRKGGRSEGWEEEKKSSDTNDHSSTLAHTELCDPFPSEASNTTSLECPCRLCVEEHGEVGVSSSSTSPSTDRRQRRGTEKVFKRFSSRDDHDETENEEEKEKECPALRCSTASVSRSLSAVPSVSSSSASYYSDSSVSSSSSMRASEGTSSEHSDGKKRRDEEEDTSNGEEGRGGSEHKRAERNRSSLHQSSRDGGGRGGGGSDESSPSSINSLLFSNPPHAVSPLFIGPPENRLVCRRNAICALVNISILEEDLKIIEKSVEERKQLVALLLQNPLFTFMDDEAIDTTVDAMKVEKYVKGEVVMEQGGECLPQLYVVLDGRCHFLCQGEVVKSVGPGEYFGELQLMHPQSSAVVTVQCVMDTTFYTLHHHHYQHILLRRCLQQRDVFKRCIQGVPFLKELSEYERQRLTDALSIKQFDCGDLIISYGQRCQELYFLIEGKTRVIGRTDDGSPLEICTQDPVSVIGELEFLFEDSAVADVVVISTYAKVGRVTRQHFEAVLGPVPTSLLTFVAEAATYEPYIEKFIKTHPNRKISRDVLALKERRKERQQEPHAKGGAGGEEEGERDGGGDNVSDLNDSTKSVGGRSDGDEEVVKESDVAHAEAMAIVAGKRGLKQFHPSGGAWDISHPGGSFYSEEDSLALRSCSSFPAHLVSPPHLLSSCFSPLSHHVSAANSLPNFISSLSSTEVILRLPTELMYCLPEPQRREVGHPFSSPHKPHHRLPYSSEVTVIHFPSTRNSKMKHHSLGSASPVRTQQEHVKTRSRVRGSAPTAPHSALSSLPERSNERRRRKAERRTKEVIKDGEGEKDAPHSSSCPASKRKMTQHLAEKGHPQEGEKDLPSMLSTSSNHNNKGVVMMVGSEHSKGRSSLCPRNHVDVSSELAVGSDGQKVGGGNSSHRRMKRTRKSTCQRVGVQDNDKFVDEEKGASRQGEKVEGSKCTGRDEDEEDFDEEKEYEEEEEDGEEDIDVSAFPPFAKFPLQPILQFGASFLLCVREDGAILSWDTTLAALTGYSPNHAMGESVFAFIEKEEEHTLLQRTIDDVVNRQKKEEEERQRQRMGCGLPSGLYGSMKGHLSSSISVISPTWGGSPMLSTTLPSLHLGSLIHRMPYSVRPPPSPPLSPSASLGRHPLHRKPGSKGLSPSNPALLEGGGGGGRDGDGPHDALSRSLACHFSRLDGITSVRVELQAYALVVQTPLDHSHRGWRSDGSAHSHSSPSHRHEERLRSNSFGARRHSGRWWGKGSVSRRIVVTSGEAARTGVGEGRQRRKSRNGPNVVERGVKRNNFSVGSDRSASDERDLQYKEGTARRRHPKGEDNKGEHANSNRRSSNHVDTSTASTKERALRRRRRSHRRLVYRVVLFLGKEVGLRHSPLLSGGLDPSDMLLEMRRLLTSDAVSADHRVFLLEELVENFETIQRAHDVSTEGWQPVHLRELVGKIIMEYIRECIAKNYVIHQRFERLSSEMACIDVALLPRVLKHTLRIATYQTDECEVTMTVSIRQHGTTKFLAFVFSTHTSQVPPALAEWERLMTRRQKRSSGAVKQSVQRGRGFKGDMESCELVTEEKMDVLPGSLPQCSSIISECTSLREEKSGGGRARGRGGKHDFSPSLGASIGGGGNQMESGVMMAFSEEDPGEGGGNAMKSQRSTKSTGRDGDNQQRFLSYRRSPLPLPPSSSSLNAAAAETALEVRGSAADPASVGGGSHEDFPTFSKTSFFTSSLEGEGQSLPTPAGESRSRGAGCGGEGKVGWNPPATNFLGAGENDGRLPDPLEDFSADFSRMDPILMIGSPRTLESDADPYEVGEGAGIQKNRRMEALRGMGGWDYKGGGGRGGGGGAPGDGNQNDDPRFVGQSTRNMLKSGNSSSCKSGGAGTGGVGDEVPQSHHIAGVSSSGRGKLFDILSITHPRFRNYLRGIRHAVEQQGGTIRISRDEDNYHLIYLFPFVPAEDEGSTTMVDEEANKCGKLSDTRRMEEDEGKEAGLEGGKGVRTSDTTAELPPLSKRHPTTSLNFYPFGGNAPEREVDGTKGKRVESAYLTTVPAVDQSEGPAHSFLSRHTSAPFFTDERGETCTDNATQHPLAPVPPLYLSSTLLDAHAVHLMADGSVRPGEGNTDVSCNVGEATAGETGEAATIPSSTSVTRPTPPEHQKKSPRKVSSLPTWRWKGIPSGEGSDEGGKGFNQVEPPSLSPTIGSNPALSSSTLPQGKSTTVLFHPTDSSPLLPLHTSTPSPFTNGVVTQPEVGNASPGHTSLPYSEEQLSLLLKNISFTTLVADENTVQRNLFCKFLWQRKHAVLYAVTFDEMEKLVDSVDILIIDALQFAFQNSDTIHFLQEKARELSIVVTGEMDSISCEAYAGTGFLVMPKPVHPNTFRTVIAKAEERIRAMKKDALSICLLRQTLSGYRMTGWTRGELLGKGAHGEVYRATSVATGVEMAVKEMRVGPDTERLEEVLTEITTMCSLQHPNIIHYFSCELSTEAVLMTSASTSSRGTSAPDGNISGEVDAYSGAFSALSPPPPLLSSPVLYEAANHSPTPTLPRGISFPSTSFGANLSTRGKKSRLLLASPRDVHAAPPPVNRFLRLFMEYASGGSLREYLTKHGPLEFRMYQTLLHQIVSGLAYIHANQYVHGDMKTPNILLTDQLVGKIGDFGSARRLMDGELCYKMEGSVAYMSPECLSAGEVNESGQRTGFSFPTDIWSLGVVAIEMITNQSPYSHVKGVIGPASLTQYLTTLESETPDLSPLFQYPPCVTEFIAACLQVNPLKRATAEQLLHFSIFHESSDVETMSALKALRQAELRHALSQYAAFQEPSSLPPGRDGVGSKEDVSVRMSSGGAAILADDSDDFFDSDTTEESEEERKEEENELSTHKKPMETIPMLPRHTGDPPPSPFLPDHQSSFFMGSNTAQDSMVKEEKPLPYLPLSSPPQPPSSFSPKSKSKEEGFFPLRLNPLKLMKQDDERSDVSSGTWRTPVGSARGEEFGTMAVAASFRDAGPSSVNPVFSGYGNKSKSGFFEERKERNDNTSYTSSLHGGYEGDGGIASSTPVIELFFRSRRSSINEIAACTRSGEYLHPDHSNLLRPESTALSDGASEGGLPRNSQPNSNASSYSSSFSPFYGDGGGKEMMAPRYRLLNSRTELSVGMMLPSSTPMKTSLGRSAHNSSYPEGSRQPPSHPLQVPASSPKRASLLHPLDSVSPANRAFNHISTSPRSNNSSNMNHNSYSTNQQDQGEKAQLNLLRNSKRRQDRCDRLKRPDSTEATSFSPSPNFIMTPGEQERGSSARGLAMGSNEKISGFTSRDPQDEGLGVDASFQNFPQVFHFHPEKASPLTIGNISSTAESNHISPSETSAQDGVQRDSGSYVATASPQMMKRAEYGGGGRASLPFNSNGTASSEVSEGLRERGVGWSSPLTSSSQPFLPPPPLPSSAAPQLPNTSFDRHAPSRDSVMQRMRSHFLSSVSPSLSRGARRSTFSVRGSHGGLEDAADALANTMSRGISGGSVGGSTDSGGGDLFHESSLTHSINRMPSYNEIGSDSGQGGSRQGLNWSRMTEGSIAAFSPALRRRRMTFFAEESVLPPSLAGLTAKATCIPPMSPQKQSLRGGERDGGRGGFHLSPFHGSPSATSHRSISGAATPTTPQPLPSQDGTAWKQCSFPPSFAEGS